jgi:hypothetical protein
MPEHYSKTTVEVKAWCNVCHRETMHRVDHGQRGPCLMCLKKRESETAERKSKPPAAPTPTQGNLF